MYQCCGLWLIGYDDVYDAFCVVIWKLEMISVLLALLRCFVLSISN